MMDELKKVGDNIYINDYELSVLIKYGIDVSKCKTINEVLLLIDYYVGFFEFTDEEYEEIDLIANILSERLYYMQNK